MQDQAPGSDQDYRFRPPGERYAGSQPGAAAETGGTEEAEPAVEEVTGEPAASHAWLRLPVWRYLGTAILILAILLLIGLVCSPRYWRF